MNVLYGSMRHRTWARTGTQPKQQYWRTTDRIQSGADLSDLSPTRLQEYDAPNSIWKEKGKIKHKSKDKGKRTGKGKSMRKGKEKGKSKDKSKEGTSDTSNTKCSFFKGKDRPKSLRWPALRREQ